MRGPGMAWLLPTAGRSQLSNVAHPTCTSLASSICSSTRTGEPHRSASITNTIYQHSVLPLHQLLELRVLAFHDYLAIRGSLCCARSEVEWQLLSQITLCNLKRTPDHRNSIAILSLLLVSAGTSRHSSGRAMALGASTCPRQSSPNGRWGRTEPTHGHRHTLCLSQPPFCPPLR